MSQINKLGQKLDNIIEQYSKNLNEGRVLQETIFEDDEINMSDVIGIDEIKENIQKMDGYFEGYEKLVDSMKEEISKKLIVIKERLQRPDLKMMGMHPGMNYPYTAYPMGGGNEDDKKEDKDEERE